MDGSERPNKKQSQPTLFEGPTAVYEKEAPKIQTEHFNVICP